MFEVVAEASLQPVSFGLPAAVGQRASGLLYPLAVLRLLGSASQPLPSPEAVGQGLISSWLPPSLRPSKDPLTAQACPRLRRLPHVSPEQQEVSEDGAFRPGGSSS